MMKETDSIYAYKVEHTKDFSFKTMMKLASDFVNDLDEEQINELFEQLKRGVDLLSTEPQMNMYLYAYGKMHEAKLKLAFENMGEDYKQMDDFAIVDYGCGQGLASIVLYDRLKALGLEKNVHKVVLIEPSEAALKRAALHVSKAFPKAEIVTVNKFFDNLTKEDIKCENMMVFHLFSNILDVESVSLKHLSNIVNTTKSNHKKIICVSPNFGGLERNKRIDVFCSKLVGKKSYSCDKLKGEWKNDWSCKVRVYSEFTFKPKTEPRDSKVEESLSTGVTEKDLAEGIADEFGVIYSKDGRRLLKGNRRLEEYAIKEGVLVVCDNAFANNSFDDKHVRLRSITIPNTVRKIGKRSFHHCAFLNRIEFSDNITEIKEDSFSCCKSLKRIKLPLHLLSLGERSFSECENLLDFCFPSKLRIIGIGAFDFCESLQDLVVPESVTTIGNLAFAECTSLKRIKLPMNLELLGAGTFQGCTSLVKVNLPSKLTSIPDKLFCGCESLNEIKIPNKLVNIGNNAFEGCSSLLEVIIPDSVSEIGVEAFVSCGKLKKVCLPISIKEINECTFCGCKSLKSIRLPMNLRYIGICAFGGCGLIHVYIPKSVEAIDYVAFEDCELLKTIKLNSNLCSCVDYANWLDGCKLLQQIIIPKGTLMKFKELLPEYKDLLFEK